MGGTQSNDDDGAPVPPMPTTPAGVLGRPSATHVPSLGPRPSHPPTPFNPRHSAHPLSPSTQHFPPENHQAPVQHSGIVANVLNVVKNSVKLISLPAHPHIYLLEFVFDAQVDGFITIYYCARQVIHRVQQSTSSDAPILKVSYSAKGDRLSGKTPFSKGQKQRYRQNIDKGLDVRNFTSAELQTIDINHYPVVIRLEALYPDDTTVPLEQQIKCQTTFATLVPQNGSYKLQMIGQQVLVNGTIYKILDLYGIGGRDITATKNKRNNYSVDATDECVICLTEPCNTAVEPCNHLCLCEDCARTLWTEPDRNRRKCPVCRSELVKLLQIIPAPDQSPSSPDNNDTKSSTDVQTTATLREQTESAASSTNPRPSETKVAPTVVAPSSDSPVNPTSPPSQHNRQGPSPAPQQDIDLSTLTLDPSARNAPC